MENRNGLIAAAMATKADGHAERDTALLMLDERQKIHSRRITVGTGKAYDTADFIAIARALNVTAHVQKNETGAARTSIGEAPGTPDMHLGTQSTALHPRPQRPPYFK